MNYLFYIYFGNKFRIMNSDRIHFDKKDCPDNYLSDLNLFLNTNYQNKDESNIFYPFQDLTITIGNKIISEKIIIPYFKFINNNLEFLKDDFKKNMIDLTEQDDNIFDMETENVIIDQIDYINKNLHDATYNTTKKALFIVLTTLKDFNTYTLLIDDVALELHIENIKTKEIFNTKNYIHYK